MAGVRDHIQIDLTSGQELGRYFWNVQWGRKSRKEREMALGEPYDLLLRLEQLWSQKKVILTITLGKQA